MDKESSRQRPVEANITGGQGSRRAVTRSDDDDDDDNDDDDDDDDDCHFVHHKSHRKMLG